jgi:Tol biopolymer transport system component/DNA-binding winged helix-turn-helix (wHTH) protein
VKSVTQSSGIIRFGVFELDLATRELQKSGLKVKLQDQPFQVLAVLLERPGHLVTREDLQKRLWPADTFVDFDQGLGTAIRKLREALGDSADNPRFIETLPRRGFRFIAPVNGGAAGEQPGALFEQSEVTQSAQRRLPRVAVLVTGAVFGLAALAYWLRPPLPAPRVLRTVQLTNDHRSKFPIMVTDGFRIYLSEGTNTLPTPVTVSTSGGEVMPIPLPFKGSSILDISPDGTELLLVTSSGWPQTQGGLWAVATVGGAPRRLGDLVAAEATWSPDGQEILYTRDNDNHLYVASADGTKPRTLVATPGWPYFIRWSPDGRRISVSVDETLWEVSADGTNLHPVLPGWDSIGGACSGHWTPDGKYLLFDSERGGLDNLWVIPERTSVFYKVSRQPMQLTAGPGNLGRPLPSKDGKRIFVIGNPPLPQLDRYDSKSGAWKPFLTGISAEHVDISRDGQWAAYVSYPDANLFRSRLDGSQKLQLTAHPVEAARPRLSPDGKEVVYMARTPGKRWRIWLTPFAGGDHRQLTSGDYEESEPSWSPDGRYVAFGRSAASQPPSDGPGDTICLLDMNSKEMSKIPAKGGRDYPRWSPDGRYIAAIGDDFHKVMLFDSRTQKWSVLFHSSSKEPAVYEPSWSHDGQWIYFIDYTIGYYRVRIRDRKLEEVVGASDHSLFTPGTNGGWHGLTPDDSLLALTRTEEREIYALDWEAP